MRISNRLTLALSCFTSIAKLKAAIFFIIIIFVISLGLQNDVWASDLPDNNSKDIKSLRSRPSSPVLGVPGNSLSPTRVETEARGSVLKTKQASESDLTGTFTLILYGGHYLTEIETFAILDVEGDWYTFVDFAPTDPLCIGYDSRDYKVLHGLSAKAAIEVAEKFVSGHPDFSHAQLSGILNNAGKIIGYEVKPLYYPFSFGVSDIIDVRYRIGSLCKFSSVIDLSYPTSVIFTVTSKAPQ